MFGTLMTLIHQIQVCHFAQDVATSFVSPRHYEQKPNGKLRLSKCRRHKCIHVDVFEWVWAWDCNIGAYIHYPTTRTRFPVMCQFGRCTLRHNHEGTHNEMPMMPRIP